MILVGKQERKRKGEKTQCKRGSERTVKGKQMAQVFLPTHRGEFE
jgi:hypothetical protein